MDNNTAPVKRVDRTIWLFGLGYFIAYTPYAGLVKAMSAGKLPGLAGIEGLTLLPSVLAGTIVTLPIFVLLLGWWRYARVPTRAMIISGFGTSLTLAAIINLAVYLLGYQIRLPQMTKYAKVEHPETTRTYFVGEIMVTLIFLALIPLIGAALGVSTLRNGLAVIVSGSATANVGFVIGALYATLYVFTTLIYLDRRENTFCMAMNCCSSLLAGIAASYALSQLLNMPTPAWFELTGVGMIIVALMLLSPLHHIPEWTVARLSPPLR